MFKDPFAGTANSVIAPAADCFEIVPNDTNELSQATKAIYIGVGGDLVARSVNGSQDVTFRNLPGGSILDVRLRAVRSTGTTAGNLIGLV